MQLQKVNLPEYLGEKEVELWDPKYKKINHTLFSYVTIYIPGNRPRAVLVEYTDLICHTVPDRQHLSVCGMDHDKETTDCQCCHCPQQSEGFCDHNPEACLICHTYHN